MNMNIIIKVTKDTGTYFPMTSYIDGYLNASVNIRKIPAYITLSMNDNEIRVVIDEEEDVDARELVEFINDISKEIKNVDGYELIIRAE